MSVLRVLGRIHSSNPRASGRKTSCRARRPAILYIPGMISMKFGSLEEHCVQMATEAQRRGWRLIVVYPRQPASARYLSALRSFGVLIETCDPDSIGWLRAAYTLFALIRAQGVRIVHTRFGAIAYVAAAVARVAGIPAFRTKGGLGNDRPMSLYGFTVRAASPLFSRIFAVSDAVREDQLRYGLPNGKVETLYCGIRVERFRRGSDGSVLRRELGIPVNAPVVGTIAQAVPDKNVACLVNAMTAVIRRFPDAWMMHVGGGPLVGDLKKQCEELGLADRALFIGVRDDPENVYPAIDVFVLPSVSEGLGLVLLEASAAERPIVASRVGGIPEAVKDGETGLLVPVDDPRALADAVITLLADPAARHRMGRAGRAMVEQRFDVRRCVSDLFRRYDQVLAASK